ncbi:MAG: LysR substrate-binding domain-containing protein [Alphaproteobacteria bacterium]
MKNIDMDCLRTFVAFGDTGSCRATAQLVYRSQAAISVQLKKLQDTVNVELYERSGRNLVLTDDGRAFLSYARKIIALQDEALASFESSSVSGTVRVGLPDDTLTSLSSMQLANFNRLHPRVTLDIRCAPTPVLRPMVREGKIDVAVVAAETDDREGILLSTDRVGWIAAEGLDFASPHALPLAFCYDGCVLRRWAINALTGVKRDYRIVCTASNTQVLRAIASSGMAATVVTLTNDLPNGCVELSPENGFPTLPPVGNILIKSPSATIKAVDLFYEHVQCFSPGSREDWSYLHTF